MPNLIDWYVVDLKLLLTNQLPKTKVEEIVKEAEAHLWESVRHRLNAAASQEDAIVAAIQAYGSPEKVALGYIKNASQKMAGIALHWWVVLALIVGIWSWNFHWLTLSSYFDNLGETWQNGLAGIVGTLSLVLLVVAVRRSHHSRRDWVVGTTLAAATLSIPLVSFWMIPTSFYRQGVSRLHIARDKPAVARSLNRIKTYQAYIARGTREYAAAKTERDLSLELRDIQQAKRGFHATFTPAVGVATTNHGGAFLVPRENGAFITLNGADAVLETVQQFSDAKKAWADNSKRIKEDLDRQLAVYTDLSQKLSAASNGKIFFFNPDLYMETFLGTLMLLPLFLLVDWLAALSARPKRSWPQTAIA